MISIATYTLYCHRLYSHRLKGARKSSPLRLLIRVRALASAHLQQEQGNSLYFYNTDTAKMTTLAAVCIKEGDPTLPLGPVLTVQPWTVPDPKPGWLKIAVEGCSLNYADPLTVKGEYQVKLKTPFVPGCEASGTVIALGAGVTRFKPGDKVTAFHQSGMFAQQCVVPEACAWPVPDGVDLAAASAVPVTYGTADLALRHRAGLKKGQCVLVLGAGGGVGVSAIQIAKLSGAHVIAVTQGADKVSFVKSQGADVAIDLNDTSDKLPLNQLVKKHAPKGVHVVIDPVGGSLFNEALKTVAWGAHIVVIGFAAGGIPKVKNTTVHGLFWGSYLQHQPQILRTSMDDIMSWLKAGLIKPHVSHRFSLEQLPEAFRTMLNRKVLGKILLLPGKGTSKL